MNKFKIYIGWDPNETRAYDVALKSIRSRSSQPKVTQIFPLELKSLTHVMNRKTEIRDGKLWCPISDAPMSTEFAISRFAVPVLQTKGWVLFCDCDILCQADIVELFKLADEKFAVMLVKHNQVSTETTKMVNQIQTAYPRKNWSSVVLWNCGHASNRKITTEVLNTWPGRDLHAFKWLTDEEIGDLPHTWNYLVGVDPAPTEAQKILHYTLGGPWIKGWAGGPMDEAWNLEAAK